VLGSDLDSQFEKRIQESQSQVTCFKMQQKTDGRVVRLLTKHLAAEDQSLEQWFLVAIADDEKAKDAVAKTAKGADEVIEVVGNIPARSLASWGLTDGEVRLVLPGEPINSTA
jgi:hypothetical protein